MKKLLVIVLLLITTYTAESQATADIGFWAGSGTYFGDMTQINMGSSLALNYGAFVRYNFNPRISARLQFLNGTIKGSGEFESHDWEFSKSVTNVSLMAEINFLKYFMGRKETPYSPYLLAGIGVGRFPYSYDYTKLQGVVSYLQLYNGAYNSDLGLNTNVSKTQTSLQIPVGFGFKYNLTKRLGIGIEVLFNKYLNDKLDDLDDPRKSFTVDNTTTPVTPTWTSFNDQLHNNDWTTYMGLNLTYKIELNKKACPVYEKLND